MKLLSLLLLMGLFTSAFSSEFPAWASDLKYFESGSCQTGNLSFNAARFSKIALAKKREDLDVYLQTILFINEDGQVKIRTLELGLAGCKDTPQGEVCSYRPFNDTKKMYSSTWNATDDLLSVEGFGQIKKIRDDFPWRGFELTISQNFPNDVVRGIHSIGGKVQVNFNEHDQNSAIICR